MLFHRLKASCCVALATFLVATAQAGKDAGVDREGIPKTRVVKQADCREVVHLAALQPMPALLIDTPLPGIPT